MDVGGADISIRLSFSVLTAKLCVLNLFWFLKLGAVMVLHGFGVVVIMLGGGAEPLWS